MDPAELLNCIYTFQDNGGLELKAFLQLCFELAGLRSFVEHCGSAEAHGETLNCCSNGV